MLDVMLRSSREIRFARKCPCLKLLDKFIAHPCQSSNSGKHKRSPCLHDHCHRAPYIWKKINNHKKKIQTYNLHFTACELRLIAILNKLHKSYNIYYKSGLKCVTPQLFSQGGDLRMSITYLVCCLWKLGDVEIALLFSI